MNGLQASAFQLKADPAWRTMRGCRLAKCEHMADRANEVEMVVDVPLQSHSRCAERLNRLKASEGQWGSDMPSGRVLVKFSCWST